jgi:hypothetical protein
LVKGDRELQVDEKRSNGVEEFFCALGAIIDIFELLQTRKHLKHGLQRGLAKGKAFKAVWQSD